eukprot:jgi/Bigna1/89030/estExt_fgenesh1_pg.C_420125
MENLRQGGTYLQSALSSTFSFLRSAAGKSASFNAVSQDERLIRELVEKEDDPLVWASIDGRWRRLEIVGIVKSRTAMYGLMEPVARHDKISTKGCKSSKVENDTVMMKKKGMVERTESCRSEEKSLMIKEKEAKLGASSESAEKQAKSEQKEQLTGPEQKEQQYDEKVYFLYPELLSAEKPPENMKGGLQACFQWHHRRRAKMLSKYPKIRRLMHSDRKPVYEAWIGGILAIHLATAVACAYLYDHIGRTIPSSSSSFNSFGWNILPAAVPLAAVISIAAMSGAACAFNLQQLTHEISHNVLRPSYVLHALMFIVDLSFGICGPGWHSYYILLHSQHHSNAGSMDDPDVSFQMYWSVLPHGLTTTRIGRVAWLTIFALFTQPVVLICHCFGVNRLNFLMEYKGPLFLLISCKIGFWFAFFKIFGAASVIYLWMASGFALGAFGHPYVGFWLIQHLAVGPNGHQPTVSYGGSNWWHWANLGALRHVEHHDFPTIPFTDVHKVREIAPEFYDTLHQVKSIRSITSDWIHHTDGSAWMDFAANQRWIMSRSELPVIDSNKPRTLRGVLIPTNDRARNMLKTDSTQLKRMLLERIRKDCKSKSVASSSTASSC